MRVYRYNAPRDEAAEAAEVYERVVAAINTLDRLPSNDLKRLASNWPREFAFHAEAIRWTVWAGKARNDKNFKRLRWDDFADIYLGPSDDDDLAGRVDRTPPSREAIADAEIAGGYWSALARLPENIDEFRAAKNAYRWGRRPVPWVDDQRIVAWHARGVSLRSIGAKLEKGKLSEHEVETRIKRIATDLANIARECTRQNGRDNEAVGAVGRGSPAR